MTQRSEEARHVILERLRRALGGSRRVFRDDGSRGVTFEEPTAVTSAEGESRSLAHLFGAKLEATNGSYDIVPGPAGVAKRVIQLVTEWNASSASPELLSWSSDELPIPGIAEQLEQAGIALVVPDDLRNDDLARAERITVGLTSVEAAFASTGSVVLVPGPGKSRAASLLPVHHLMLVPTSRIHPTFEAWIRGLRREERIEDLLRKHAQIVFVTGPSKSADIELKLTLGVHGPRVVHAIVFDDTP